MVVDSRCLDRALSVVQAVTPRPHVRPAKLIGCAENIARRGGSIGALLQDSSAQGGQNGARPRAGLRRERRGSGRRERACSYKRVQSRAYAPPQGPPARSLHITRDTNIIVAADHTLTRVGGPKSPRHGPRLHTATRRATKPTTVASSRPHMLSTHLARRLPARWRSGSAQHTRQHARTSR